MRAWSSLSESWPLPPQAFLSQLVKDLMSSLSILSGSEDEAVKAAETTLSEGILTPTLRLAFK